MTERTCGAALRRLAELRAIRSPILDGIRYTNGNRVIPANSGGFGVVAAVFDGRDGLARGQHRENPHDWTACEPDLSNPATLGCLLALAREAWAAPLAHLVPYATHDRNPDGGDLVPVLWWALSTTADSAPLRLTDRDGTYHAAGATEGEALTAALWARVDALEAARA